MRNLSLKVRQTIRSVKIINPKQKPVDRVLVYSVIGLTLFGLLMLYDASISYSLSVFGNKFRFFFLQLTWIAIGLSGMYFFATIDLEFIKKSSSYIFSISLFLLFIILLPKILSILDPISPSVYGARRWLILNPVPLPLIPGFGRLSFQPSELAKFASVVFVAAFLSSQKISKQSAFKVFARFILIIALLFGLIVAEPDFTTAFILSTILVGMYFLGNGEVLFVGILGILMPAIGALYAFSSDYRRLRIQTLFDPESIDKLGSGYHIRQIMIALGSGGIWGLGLGKSRQKFAYLPEVTSDSIFAIIGEELGFVGSTFTIAVYVFIIWRMLKIAAGCSDKFSILLISGITIWFSVQAFINLAAMARLMPLTGVPLPLISYGGSSTVFLMCGIGLILNASRNAKIA